MCMASSPAAGYPWTVSDGSVASQASFSRSACCHVCFDGAFWKNYKPTNMLKGSINLWYLLRLIIALFGYSAGIIYSGKVR